MSSLEKELKERAECLFQQKQLGKGVHDYRAKEEATRQLTFKLRVEHLAREAVRAKPATFAENQKSKAPAATLAVDGTF
jgi:hypothetical protein